MPERHAPTRPAAIAVAALTKRFGDFVAVDAVSFTVEQGSVFGFLGPNGAGKTTTIRMLTGLLQPSSGSAMVAGHDVALHPAALRRSIGYMSQSFSLYGDLTVSENIELFAGLYGVRGIRYRERRARVLAMAGLGGRETTVTAELPLGYKQRLALGCAVLHEPPVLFLDEPTSGVDPLARRAFWDLIHELARAGTTVLVSTHYMEEAEYCGRVLLMNRGRVIADDAPATLRHELDEVITEVEAPRADAAAVLLGARLAGAEVVPFGRTLRVVLPAGQVRRDEATALVRRVLEDAQLEATAVREVPPTLEDVFVSLVRRQGGAVAG